MQVNNNELQRQEMLILTTCRLLGHQQTPMFPSVAINHQGGGGGALGALRH